MSQETGVQEMQEFRINRCPGCFSEAVVFFGEARCSQNETMKWVMN